MASVKLSQKNGVGALVVDGVDISKFTSQVTLICEGAKVPMLTVGVVAWGENDVALDEAQLVVSGIMLPLSVELAMYAYLKKKHDPVEAAALSDGPETAGLRCE